MQAAIGIHVVVAAFAAAQLTSSVDWFWLAMLAWNAWASFTAIRTSSIRWADWLEFRAKVEHDIERGVFGP
jgi:hypothetical protein